MTLLRNVVEFKVPAEQATGMEHNNSCTLGLADG
jgi:hypothetical protein